MLYNQHLEPISTVSINPSLHTPQFTMLHKNPYFHIRFNHVRPRSYSLQGVYVPYCAPVIEYLCYITNTLNQLALCLSTPPYTHHNLQCSIKNLISISVLTTSGHAHILYCAPVTCIKLFMYFGCFIFNGMVINIYRQDYDVGNIFISILHFF